MRIIINPKYDYLSSYLHSIPSEFDKQKGGILYEARNLLRKVRIDNIELVIKSFRKPRLLNRFVYTFLRKPKALRSYQYSQILLDRGILAPDPVACILEYRNKLITRSYYVNRYERSQTVRKLMEDSIKGNEGKLHAFSEFLVDLHQKGVLHLDLSPGNILMHTSDTHGYEFSLIDVNRMKFQSKIDIKTACYNLRRLCTSREVLEYIASEYAMIRGWDKDDMVYYAQHYSDNFFRKFFYHRASTRSKAKNIHWIILRFYIYTHLRKLLPAQMNLSQKIFDKEKHIYVKYLTKYDFRKIFYHDYL